jgi:hypothetical protein
LATIQGIYLAESLIAAERCYLSQQGPMSEEFFTLLRQVVHNATQTNTQGENLWDSIIRDTLSKVAANTNDRVIPDVLKNLERYVTFCHYQSYPVSLILRELIVCSYHISTYAVMKRYRPAVDCNCSTDRGPSCLRTSSEL